jgi:hypothetical protein
MSFVPAAIVVSGFVAVYIMAQYMADTTVEFLGDNIPEKSPESILKKNCLPSLPIDELEKFNKTNLNKPVKRRGNDYLTYTDKLSGEKVEFEKKKKIIQKIFKDEYKKKYKYIS